MGSAIPDNTWRWDYFILTARTLLAFIFMSYGVAKLIGLQFSISPDVLAQPLGRASLAHVAWYCFGHEPFNTYVGVSQIVASLLLLWRRTALLGAVLLLPIATTIFIIDLTYLPDIIAFRYALPFYLGLLLLIFYHHRDRVWLILRALIGEAATQRAYPWWAYLLLPVAAGLLSLGWLLPKYGVDFMLNPAGTLRYFSLVFAQLKQLIC